MKKYKLQLLIMFAVIMAASFIPENFHSFFGDWYCQGSGVHVPDTYSFSKCDYGSYHNAEWHWGFRHWLWLAMGITFCVINIVEIVNAKENGR